MAYTKEQAEAQKNALLASDQPIPAVKHRQFEQVLIDELYDSQARGNILNAVQAALSYVGTDKIFILRPNGQVYWLPSAQLPSSGGGGGSDFQGNLDASTNTLPAGSPGNWWVITVAGTLEDVNGDPMDVYPHDLLFRTSAGSTGASFRRV